MIVPRVVSLLLLVPPACRGFADPPADLLEALRVRAAAEPRSFRGRATVSIDSSRLRGEFEALTVARAGPPVLVRLQLWPDLGGKVLDVVASPTRIRGALGRGDAQIDTDPATAPRHPLVFFALTLLENAAPLTPERVLGARQDQDSGLFELRLTPVAGDYDLRAWVDVAGRTTRRRYRFRHVTWTESLSGGHTVEAKSFALAIEGSEVERDVEIPARVFEVGPQ